MGTSFYPELNPDLPDVHGELGVGGKPIARAMPLLDVWAREAAVPELISYYSESVEECFAKIGEPVPDGMDETPIEWFAAENGLRTVRSLIAHLRSERDTTLRIEHEGGEVAEVSVVALADDLAALESVLMKAGARGSRFRLRVDI